MGAAATSPGARLSPRQCLPLLRGVPYVSSPALGSSRGKGLSHLGPEVAVELDVGAPFGTYLH